jgi:hypothetical protein
MTKVPQGRLKEAQERGAAYLAVRLGLVSIDFSPASEAILNTFSAVLSTTKENGWRTSPAVLFDQSKDLPVSTTAVATATAAVESAATATAVEATTTEAAATAVESATGVPAVESACCAYITAVESACCAYISAVESARPACECVATAGIARRSVVKTVTSPGVPNSTVITAAATVAVVVSGVAIVSTATIVAATAVIATATPVPVIPGAGADEQPAYEPARTVVAVGRASVRIIVVVTPGANRSGIAIVTVPIAVANPYPYTDLCVSRSRHQRCGNQRAEQQKISEKLHLVLRAKASCIA